MRTPLVSLDAIRSQASFSGCPRCPSTCVTRTWWMANSASSFCQRSTFDDRLELVPFFALPALAFPVGQPLADSLGHILAVGDQLDLARALELASPSMTPSQLHAIVGRLGSAPETSRCWPLAGCWRMKAQPPGPGVAAASAVREQPHRSRGARRPFHRIDPSDAANRRPRSASAPRSSTHVRPIAMTELQSVFPHHADQHAQDVDPIAEDRLHRLVGGLEPDPVLDRGRFS